MEKKDKKKLKKLLFKKGIYFTGKAKYLLNKLK